MAASSFYQDAFVLYTEAFGAENAIVYLPDTPDNRKTRNKYLNALRMAWKQNLARLPKEFHAGMDGVRFLSHTRDGTLYVYADGPKEQLPRVDFYG